MYDMTGNSMDEHGSTLSVGSPVFLSPGCGCENARFRQSGVDSDRAECEVCGQDVTVSIDIEPHLDPGERLVWIPDTTGLALAYFHEEIEDPEDD